MELRLDPEIPVTRVVNGHNVFNKGYHHGLRGKTYEEYYGKERAVEIRCMAELACLSLDKRIEEVRPYNKEVTGITYLRLTDTLKVLDELSDILYKGGYCDLNQSDNCKRGMAIIQRKLTDCDIISRAINESDKLNPAGDDE